MEKVTVAVLFGGASTEHEVSLESAAAVISSIPQHKYNVVCIGITKAGSWFHYDGDVTGIRDGSWQRSETLKRAAISHDHGDQGILILNNGRYETIPVDCFFPVLHGKNGEDGTVQGLLQLSGLPYVGCDTLSSALCMDKVFTQELVRGAGIQTTDYTYFDRQTYTFQQVKSWIDERGYYPVFVKPANSGSSFGITKVYNDEQLFKAIDHAFTFDDKVICEFAVVGMEVGCAVYGNEAPETGLIGEIEKSRDFLDFDDKYILGEIKQYVPARQSADVLKKVQALGVQVYRLLGCRGMARVDFFIRPSGEIIFNEINTMPGFTPSSRYPKMIEGSGISYANLLDELIQLAFDA